MCANQRQPRSARLEISDFNPTAPRAPRHFRTRARPTRTTRANAAVSGDNTRVLSTMYAAPRCALRATNATKSFAKAEKRSGVVARASTSDKARGDDDDDDADGVDDDDPRRGGARRTGER